MMPLILNLLHSSNVVMILSQILLVAQAVIPVTQLLVPGENNKQPELNYSLSEMQCQVTKQSIFVIGTFNS